MTLTPDQQQTVQSSSEIYRREVMQINEWIEHETDDTKLNKLYLLRTIATIEHGNRIGLFDEQNSEAYLEAIGEEVDRHFPEKEDDDLHDDLLILDDGMKNRLFANPQTEKAALLKALHLTL